MKQKQMTAIAVACGAVCAVCVALFMASVQGEADAARSEALARYGGEQVEALVATRDIVAGERVDLSAVETKLWIADLLPENAVRLSSDAVGKTLTSTIFKGEVVTTGRFETEQSTLNVPAGKRAVSVPAKAVQAVGGAIQAGMNVDVYSSGDTATTLIAHDVNVLATSVGKSNVLSSSDNGWITLAIESDRVEEIIAASSKTTLYFTLPGESIEDDGNKDDAEAKPAENAPAEQKNDEKPAAEATAEKQPAGGDAQ